MAPDDPAGDAATELAEQQQKKDDEVLEREPLEQELMQEGASERGEEIESADAERGG